MREQQRKGKIRTSRYDLFHFWIGQCQRNLTFLFLLHLQYTVLYCLL